jgi:hypothetical protein
MSSASARLTPPNPMRARSYRPMRSLLESPPPSPCGRSEPRFSACHLLHVATATGHADLLCPMAIRPPHLRQHHAGSVSRTRCAARLPYLGERTPSWPSHGEGPDPGPDRAPRVSRHRVAYGLRPARTPTPTPGSTSGCCRRCSPTGPAWCRWRLPRW